MADNITAPGAGTVFASDDISGVQFPRIKVSWGVDGAAVDASAAAPFPVTLGLTDAQLRASAVAVSFIGQSVGITGPVAVTGTFWQATQPVSIASAVSVTPPVNATTTRIYDIDAGVLQAFTATSSAAIALPTLGASREIRFRASAACWVRWGTSGVTAAAAAGTSFAIEANAPEVIPIPAGATHFRVIRDTADGSLLLTPVA